MTTGKPQRSNSSAPLSCAEFQEQLPEIFAASDQDVLADPSLTEHLRTCENCSALVRDLQYIADQARQLLEPTHEPSDNVWEKIQKSLQSDPNYTANPHKQ